MGDGEITESEYYLKEIKFPMNPVTADKEYTVSLHLDDDNQLMVQNKNENENAEETAELLKDLFPYEEAEAEERLIFLIYYKAGRKLCDR